MSNGPTIGSLSDPNWFCMRVSLWGRRAVCLRDTKSGNSGHLGQKRRERKALPVYFPHANFPGNSNPWVQFLPPGLWVDSSVGFPFPSSSLKNGIFIGAWIIIFVRIINFSPFTAGSAIVNRPMATRASKEIPRSSNNSLSIEVFHRVPGLVERLANAFRSKLMSVLFEGLGQMGRKKDEEARDYRYKGLNAAALHDFFITCQSTARLCPTAIYLRYWDQ